MFVNFKLKSFHAGCKTNSYSIKGYLYLVFTHSKLCNDFLPSYCKFNKILGLTKNKKYLFTFGSFQTLL